MRTSLYKIWTANILIFFCGHATYWPLSRAAFDWPPAELEKLGYRTEGKSRLRKSAGTLSQPSESKSDCQTIGAAWRLTCQLQVDNRGLGTRWELSQSGRRSVSSRPPASERSAFDSEGCKWLSESESDVQSTKAFKLTIGDLGMIPVWPFCNAIYHNICCEHSYDIMQNVLSATCYTQHFII